MIDANIGSAKDNMKSAIHNWYKFTAGFSYKFVDLIVDISSQTAYTNLLLDAEQHLLLPKRKASHQLEMKAKK